jgi:hypothetical protein
LFVRRSGGGVSAGNSFGRAVGLESVTEGLRG